MLGRSWLDIGQNLYYGGNRMGQMGLTGTPISMVNWDNEGGDDYAQRIAARRSMGVGAINPYDPRARNVYSPEALQKAIQADRQPTPWTPNRPMGGSHLNRNPRMSGSWPGFQSPSMRRGF